MILVWGRVNALHTIIGRIQWGVASALCNPFRAKKGCRGESSLVGLDYLNNSLILDSFFPLPFWETDCEYGQLGITEARTRCA